MATVLWGARRGDVQYASPLYWNQNLPFGVPTISPMHDDFRYGDLLMISDRDAYYRVVGRENVFGRIPLLAVEMVTALDYMRRPTRARDEALAKIRGRV